MSKKTKSKDSDSEIKTVLRTHNAIQNNQNLLKPQTDAFGELLEHKSIREIDDRKILGLELRLERQMSLLKEFEDVNRMFN